MHRDLFSDLDNSVLVTDYSGVNAFRDRNYAISMTAYNPNSKSASLIKLAGFNVRTIVTARSANQHYQFICRTSIRDSDKSDVVTVYVLSLFDAEYISKMFPDAKTEFIDINLDVRSKTPDHTLDADQKAELAKLRVRKCQYDKIKRNKGSLTEKQYKKWLEVNFRIEELCA